MQLVYWLSESVDGSNPPIRARGKKECRILAEEAGGEYQSPKRVVIEYKDGFSLLCMCLEENVGEVETMAYAPSDSVSTVYKSDEIDLEMWSSRKAG